MQLRLKNVELEAQANFLNSLTLATGKGNVARIRIINLIKDKYSEFAIDRKEVIKQYAKLDKQGEPKLKDDKQHIDIPKTKLPEALESLNELENTLAVIDCTEYESQITKLISSLEEYNEPLDGSQATLLVGFLDAFEKEDK